MKSKVLMIIELIIFCGFLYIAIVNYMAKTTAGFNVVSGNSGYVVLSTFLVMIAAYILGLFSGILNTAAVSSKYKELLEFYARKNEKLAQQNEIDTDDREALQRKIASLEIALKNALDNK